MFIDTATSGRTKLIYRHMTPESGATAALLCARGMLGITAVLAKTPGHHLSVERLHAGEARLQHVFPLTENAEALLADLVAQIDLDRDPESADDATFALIHHALAAIIGTGVEDLPGLTDLGSPTPDGYLAQENWQICLNHAHGPLLALADSGA